MVKLSLTLFLVQNLCKFSGSDSLLGEGSGQKAARPRWLEEKQMFDRLLREAWQRECGIEPSDVIVNLVENTDADWSFGNSEAQFLTGKLN